jgi:hypothetical protein
VGDVITNGISKKNLKIKNKNETSGRTGIKGVHQGCDPDAKKIYIMVFDFS